jgi:hypothetical protein
VAAASGDGAVYEDVAAARRYGGCRLVQVDSVSDATASGS